MPALASGASIDSLLALLLERSLHECNLRIDFTPKANLGARVTDSGSAVSALGFATLALLFLRHGQTFSAV